MRRGVRRVDGLRQPAAPPARGLTCLAGGHALWWRVEAPDAGSALALLPRFVRERTGVTSVRDVEIP
jgi:hypothetical protein